MPPPQKIIYICPAHWFIHSVYRTWRRGERAGLRRNQTIKITADSFTITQRSFPYLRKPRFTLVTGATQFDVGFSKILKLYIFLYFVEIDRYIVFLIFKHFTIIGYQFCNIWWNGARCVPRWMNSCTFLLTLLLMIIALQFYIYQILSSIIVWIPF